MLKLLCPFDFFNIPLFMWGRSFQVLSLLSVIVLFSCEKMSSNRVWIYKDSGNISCGAESGLTLEQGLKELGEKKITVYRSQMGTDGMMRAAVCGMTKGDLLLYQVDQSALLQVNELGYQAVSEELSKVNELN